ncbi:MAG: 1-deoxy-D-xylulose-5-phosphate reductoisomerase [Rhodospirillaceae bacterium]|nr:1-deoxy-D-xylulose-5-phosphate reductoisomerase [Rhodospirillaceae bacterium]
MALGGPHPASSGSASAVNDGPRRITILGSTGSIGQSTLDLVARQPEHFAIEALTAHRNVELLIQQALKTDACLAAIGDPALYGALKDGLAGTGIAVAAGREAIAEAAARPVDWVMAGIVGAAGLEPTLRAIRQGTIVALANKESLVCAGDFVQAEVQRCGATLLPVDSEHNAIFQVFDYDQPERVARIVLTASGGPFLNWTRERMAAATPAEAVAHPNWDMGAKISVDSATLMNKGLEVIEAWHLFPVEKDQIAIVVHPQSVVHSMVDYVDGSTLAQMGTPDMRTPIAYAMAWPKRMVSPSARLDLPAAGPLTFEAPDLDRFPALALSRAALDAGGAAPAVLNAANEIAVAAFLDGRIAFLEIAETVEETLSRGPQHEIRSIDDVLGVDRAARRIAHELTMR